MSFGDNSFEDSLLYDGSNPVGLMERLGYVKQLVFSRTKLEFRLLWNKIFQKEDEELGWLLNPYRQSTSQEATMMTSFNKNPDASYQCGYDDVSGALGQGTASRHNRGLARRPEARKKKEEKSFSESALEIARYMGMGVYMTSTAFPSPFLPVNDANIYEDAFYGPQPHNMYAMSKIW